MAKDYLGAMASTIPSERLFSGDVDLITANRNRLDEDSIGKVTCLKSWLIVNKNAN